MKGKMDAQADLLQRMIEEDRRWRTAKEKGEPISWWDRGVEVGMINGVHPRTAQTLCDQGLAEMVAEGFQVRIFLGKYNPRDE